MFELSQVVLPVAHMEAAVGFYAGTLGMPIAVRDGDRYALIKAGPVKLGLAAPSERGSDRGIALGFKVADLEPVRRRLASGLGSEPPIVQGEHEVMVEIVGPDGHPLIFYAPR
jgi:catechol 2,3-dioxygenase-like lactoylglutathione lyase family enzyme